MLSRTTRSSSIVSCISICYPGKDAHARQMQTLDMVARLRTQMETKPMVTMKVCTWCPSLFHCELTNFLVIYPVDYEKAGHIVDDVRIFCQFASSRLILTTPLQFMHDVLVKSLPAGCRLTAIFDVKDNDVFLFHLWLIFLHSLAIRGLLLVRFFQPDFIPTTHPS